MLREYDRLSALSRKSSQEASKKLNSILYKPQSELLRNHEEDLSASPYRQMIETGRFETNFEVGKIYYYCKIHPNIWRTDLVQIEGHCRNEHD